MNTTTFTFQYEFGIEISHDTPLTNEQKEQIISSIQDVLTLTDALWDFVNDIQNQTELPNDVGMGGGYILQLQDVTEVINE